MRTLYSFIMLVALGLLAFAAPKAHADLIGFSYTGSDPSTGVFSAAGDLTISGPLLTNIDGSGQDGYAITGITGSRTGGNDGTQAIIGLSSGNPSFISDNDALIAPFGFDNSGLLFTTADGTAVNIYSLAVPSGGPYYESILPSDSWSHYTPGDPISLTLAAVPETVASFALLAIGLGALALFGPKPAKVFAPSTA
jgi:hypothetical protein